MSATTGRAGSASLTPIAAGKPQPIPHEVAQLTHSQVGRPGGAEFSFKGFYDIIVREQPEVLQ